MNDMANYCVDGKDITADLGRLVHQENPIENVIEGITHEVFHLWMKEKKEQFYLQEENKSEKNEILFGIVDEGLAVLTSGQSLVIHHEKQGKNYETYKKESFEIFEKLLKDNSANLWELYKKNFENIGPFYIVGNEIAKTVLQKIGIEKFKVLIDKCRTNPKKIIDEYEKIIDKKQN
jgi:hypothetical protein